MRKGNVRALLTDATNYVTKLATFNKVRSATKFKFWNCHAAVQRIMMIATFNRAREPREKKIRGNNMRKM